MVKIFFVDRYIDYSTKLFESIDTLAGKRGIDVLFLGPDDKKSILFSDQRIANSKQVWSNNNYVRKLFKYISDNKPALVHFTFELRTFGSPLSALKFPVLLGMLRLKKQRVLVSMFNIWFFRENDRWMLPDYFPSRIPRLLTTVLVKTFFSTICKLCDRIIVGTNQGKLCLVDYYHINEDKIDVIPFGISPLAHSPNPTARQKYQDMFGDKKIILYFGVLSPRKNHTFAINAFKQIAEKIPNHILVIAGASTKEFENYEKHLHDIVDDLHLNNQVIFTGFVDKDDIDVLFEMSESVLFLYSPMSDSTFAVTIAIQHKKPVIVSNIEIFKEIFPEDAAFFVNLDNPIQLSDLLLKVSTDNQCRKNIESKLVALIDKMSWETSANDHIQVYEKLLKQQFD